MCGIFAVIGKKDENKVKELSKRMGHRGPDESDSHENNRGSMLTHERLSIIDLATGKQPIRGTDTAYVVHNGEIYNHQALREGTLSGRQFRSACDSEVIVHLWEKYGHDFCNMLDGVFAFVVLDDDDRFMAARDPIGVKPLYYGYDEEMRMYMASEMKTLADQCVEFKAFPPGHYYTPETGFVKYYRPDWEDHRKGTKKADLSLLRESFTEAVRKRLMSDVPLAVLLSGGLDSSLVASLAKRLTAKGQELHSFSVGLDPSAPDLKAARHVAEFLGTRHHEIYFSIEEGIEELEKIIWHLETYDVTTVRAATPMYFLSKAITELGYKVVLSGEGADEIFGGYLYFHNAPSAEDFQKETITRVQRLSTADCLRADKSTMAHGLEARVPFLDRNFLDVAMHIRPEDKQPSRALGIPEKAILRKAFDTPEKPYLPENILWRQKEQFGDGVGYSWIDGVIEHCSKSVSDEELATARERFPHNTPKTKEGFYFRKLFHKHFPEESSARSVLQWIPKWQKNEDPSGRACDVHMDKNKIAHV